jgi:cell division protease FtsH
MQQMAMTLGGRAAEEIVFHEVTTGAANDLEKVTSTAKSMIMKFGMSEKLGPRVLGKGHDQPFLGRDYGSEADYSEEIAREIDDEIRRVIEEAHELALAVLREHMDDLHKISAILIERETIDRDQFERLLAGEDEGSVFPDEAPAEPETPQPQEEPKRQRQPRPRPFPLPGHDTPEEGVEIASGRPLTGRLSKRTRDPLILCCSVATLALNLRASLALFQGPPLFFGQVVGDLAQRPMFPHRTALEPTEAQFDLTHAVLAR